MNHHLFQQLLTTMTPQQICDELGPCLTEERKDRINTVSQHRLVNLQVALECPADLHNASAVVRSAESLGVDQIHIVHPEGDVRHSDRIMQGAGRWVSIQHYPDVPTFREYDSNKKLIFAGASPHAKDSIDEIAITEPLCLLLGNEHRGLSDEALSLCDIHYRIPMYGMTESFNLSVSAAMSLQVLATKIRQQAPVAHQISAAEILERQAFYYYQSSKPKFLAQILKKVVSKDR